MNISSRPTSSRSSVYDTTRAEEGERSAVPENDRNGAAAVPNQSDVDEQVLKHSEEAPSSLALLVDRSRTKRHSLTAASSHPSLPNDAPSTARHPDAVQGAFPGDADTNVAHAQSESLVPLDTDAPSGIASEPDRTQETAQQQDTRRRLTESDARLGPMGIGSASASRVELSDMGATFDGTKIGVKHSNIRQANQSFIDTLQFDPAVLEGYMKAVSPERADAALNLLYEMASARSQSAPPLLGEVPPPAASSVAKLDKLLNMAQAQKVDATKPLPSMPSWVDVAKSRAVSHMGSSLQAYGIYAGLMGLRDALKSGDASEAAINGASVTAEFASMFVERGLEKAGTAMLQNGGKVFNRFASTSVGAKLIRGGGLVGNALTLPFDIQGAVKSFREAAQATGKEAQDHYVAGGFASASAGLSLLLGTAAAAGYASAAGPAGLAAATLMIVGAQIYGAARQVDNIDDYIELSTTERLRTGWFAFLGKKPDESVTDRYVVAKTKSLHAERLKNEAQKILELQPRVGAIING
ncbi:hypothetical protein, partial [Burkholderia ambifaria]|uniref:hypothetical protein n=1 Tax=Burkholderia ambifaria TaxID=152480 RepID=UPI0018E082EE